MNTANRAPVTKSEACRRYFVGLPHLTHGGACSAGSSGLSIWSCSCSQQRGSCAQAGQTGKYRIHCSRKERRRSCLPTAPSEDKPKSINHCVAIGWVGSCHAGGRPLRVRCERCPRGWIGRPSPDAFAMPVLPCWEVARWREDAATFQRTEFSEAYTRLQQQPSNANRS